MNRNMLYKYLYFAILIYSVSGLVDYTCPVPSAVALSVKDFCDRSIFNDVIFASPPLPVNSAYFFKGDKVALRIEQNVSIAPGWPKQINAVWPNAPSNFDAAFTYSATGKTYFLKGSQYWRYTNFTLDDGFPLEIAEGFSGVPNDIDAATEWNKYIYFFKDNLYYRYDPCRNHSFSSPISDFTGVPLTKYDAILNHPNGNMYIFIGDMYFNYKISAQKVDPPYPYQTGWHWFSCRWQ